MTYKYTNQLRVSSVYQGIFVVIVASAISGCGPLQCTDEGCSNAVTLDLEEPLPPGEYRLTVTEDGETEACTVRLREESSSDSPERCELEGVQFDVNDSIAVYAHPAILRVSIEHLASGETVSDEYEVDYTVSSPNGEKCGPTCRSAQLTLDTSAFVSTIDDDEPTGLGGAGGMSSSP